MFFFLKSNGSVREMTRNYEICDMSNNLALNRFDGGLSQMISKKTRTL